MQNEVIIASVRRWLESIVIELNLCPFAKRELMKDRVRFVLTEAKSEEELLLTLQGELELIHRDSDIETTVLIHPWVLQDFSDYNHFLNCTDGLLAQMDFEGLYQIASFHPQYQFAGTEPGDAENFTNRSPYPLLHILREESLERAIESYPDVTQIPIRNIELMNQLGAEKMSASLNNCFETANPS